MFVAYGDGKEPDTRRNVWGGDMTLTRTRAHVRAALALLLCFSGALALAACHTPEKVVPKQIELAPKPLDPAPDPAPVPITIPACDAINTAAEAEQTAFLEAFGADTITADYGETDRTVFTEFASESALAAAEAVTQERSCNWVVFLDSVYLFQFTAELQESARDPFIADLRASDFFESTRGPATVFSSAFVTGDMRGTVGITHMFIGDIWIALIENASLNYEQGAIDAILAANPALAEATMTTCVDQTADDPVARATAEVLPREDRNGPGMVGGWDVDLATELAADTFDACAPLSWVLLPAATEGREAPEQTQTLTMFFHYGTFAGTDSEHGASARPTVTRLSRQAVSVEYGSAGGSGAAGEPQERAVATFTWDSESDSVAHEGDVPPSHWTQPAA